MTISIKHLLESAGVPVTDELLKEFGTADDAAHPALKQAMKAKRAAEREEKEADYGGMEQQPKDYEEDEDETKVFDKRSLPSADFKAFGMGSDEDEPMNDADRLDRNNQRAGEVDELMRGRDDEHENEEEDWQDDYAPDSGASAVCPKCGSKEVTSGGGQAIKDRVMAQHHECEDCGHKGQWSGPDAGLAKQRYGDPNKSEQEENTFDFKQAVREARIKIEKGEL